MITAARVVAYIAYARLIQKLPFIADDVVADVYLGAVVVE